MGKTRIYTITTVFAVHQGDDDRSVGYPKWYFESRPAADNCASGRSWYGGNAPVRPLPAITVGNVTFLLASEQPIELNKTPQDEAAEKAAALAKLTEKEKQILGLKSHGR